MSFWLGEHQSDLLRINQSSLFFLLLLFRFVHCAYRVLQELCQLFLGPKLCFVHVYQLSSLLFSTQGPEGPSTKFHRVFAGFSLKRPYSIPPPPTEKVSAPGAPRLQPFKPFGEKHFRQMTKLDPRLNCCILGHE